MKDNIKSKIHTIRGLQVILDTDLAELYNTKTKVSVGKPFSYEEIQGESQQTGKSITELAMRRLANLLPEQNRGYYR